MPRPARTPPALPGSFPVRTPNHARARPVIGRSRRPTRPSPCCLLPIGLVETAGPLEQFRGEAHACACHHELPAPVAVPLVAPRRRHLQCLPRVTTVDEVVP